MTRIGSHGEIALRGNDKIMITIRPRPVVYSLDDICIGLWDEVKEDNYDNAGNTWYSIDEYQWDWFTDYINSTKKGLIHYLLNYMYENIIMSPDYHPSNRDVSEIPEDCYIRIKNYIMACAPALGAET